MEYFFFDGAGDQGFIQKTPAEAKKVGRGSSLFYTQCIVSTGNTENTALIKQKLAELKSKYGLNLNAEFKYRKFDLVKKQPFFTDLAKLDLKAYVTVLDKFNTRYTSLQAHGLSELDGPTLTNRLLARILGDILTNSPNITDLRLIVDLPRREQNSVRLMRSETNKEISHISPYRSCKLSASDSQKDIGVQLADMIAGLVMDAYETGKMDKLKVLESKGRLFRREI